MPRATFAAEAEIRTLPDDDGPIPRQVRVFPAGWSGTIPRHQYERAKRMGVLSNDDAGQGPAAEEDGSAGEDTGAATEEDA